MKRRYSTFDIVMMYREDRMTISEIAKKVGIPESMISKKLESYHKETRHYTRESITRNETGKRGHGNSSKHPERNSQPFVKGPTRNKN